MNEPSILRLFSCERNGRGKGHLFYVATGEGGGKESPPRTSPRIANPPGTLKITGGRSVFLSSFFKRYRKLKGLKGGEGHVYH